MRLWTDQRTYCFILLCKYDISPTLYLYINTRRQISIPICQPNKCNLSACKQGLCRTEIKHVCKHKPLALGYCTLYPPPGLPSSLCRHSEWPEVFRMLTTFSQHDCMHRPCLASFSRRKIVKLWKVSQDREQGLIERHTGKSASAGLLFWTII